MKQQQPSLPSRQPQQQTPTVVATVTRTAITGTPPTQQHNEDHRSMMPRSSRRPSTSLGTTQALPAGSTFDSIRLAAFTSTGPASILPTDTTKQYCYLGQVSIAVGTVGSDGTTINWKNDTDMPNFVCTTNGTTTTTITAKQLRLPSANDRTVPSTRLTLAYVPGVCPSDYFLFQTTTSFFRLRRLCCSTSLTEPLVGAICPGTAEPERTFDRCLSLAKIPTVRRSVST